MVVSLSVKQIFLSILPWVRHTGMTERCRESDRKESERMTRKKDLYHARTEDPHPGPTKPATECLKLSAARHISNQGAVEPLAVWRFAFILKT